MSFNVCRIDSLQCYKCELGLILSSNLSYDELIDKINLYELTLVNKERLFNNAKSEQERSKIDIIKQIVNYLHLKKGEYINK